MQSVVLVGALGGIALTACGGDDSGDDSPGDGGGGGDQGGNDGGPGPGKNPDGGAPLTDATYVPPPDTLPDIPVDDPNSGAPPGAAFFKKNNPVIYMNDYPDSVYADPYVYALASNGDIQLKGVVSSGIDMMAGGDNKDSSPRRQEWIEAARTAGFTNIPDNTAGWWGAAMVKPASGNAADTERRASPGTDLIIEQAKLATAAVPLLIVSGGPITTLADAYIKDPSITKTTVVSWLVGSFQAGRNPEISLDEYNGRFDQWAAEIVLRNFRVFVFPTDLNPPIVPKCRIADELPAGSLRRLLMYGGYFMQGTDADGAPAVTINLPSYMKQYNRISMTEGLQTTVNPAGNIWLLREGDAVAGGNEWFASLRKAYKVPDGAPSMAAPPECGCMQLATPDTDAGPGCVNKQ